MPPDSHFTFVAWAACTIAFDLEGVAYLITQDGSFDEDAMVTDGVGTVTLQLLPGRGLDHRYCRTTNTQRWIRGTEGWCTVEHVDDERKRIRIYDSAGDLHDGVAEIGFDKFTAHKNV